MRKSEIKKATDNALIWDYISSHSNYFLAINTRGSTKRIVQHCADLENEMIKRGILTDEDRILLNQ